MILSDACLAAFCVVLRLGFALAQVTTISDGQRQASTATAVNTISDGQPQAPASTPSSGFSVAPQAKIKNGTVEGFYLSAYKQDIFLGIPFAQPPVGLLRYRVPQSLNTSYPSTLQAKAYYPECVGYGGDDIGYEVSEDCLALNVIRPAGYQGEDLPVAVWIHGGGLQMGGTPDRRYVYLVTNKQN